MSWVQTLVWPKRKYLTGPIRTIPPTNPSAPELNTWNYQRWKPEVRCGTVVECRTRDSAVLGSNPSVAKKKISHRSNQNNTTTNPSPPELNTLKLPELKTKSHCGTVVECRTRDARGPGFKPQCGQKEILSQVQSEQYHLQSLCTRVKYLKLSELKTKSQCGTVVECRTRRSRGPWVQILGVAKK